MKKIVALTVICTLLLVSATSVFAAGSRTSQQVTTNLFSVGTSNAVMFAQVTPLVSHINSISAISTDGEWTIASDGYGWTEGMQAVSPDSALLVDLEQEFVILIRLTNPLPHDLFINTGYLTLSINLTSPTFGTNWNRWNTGMELKDIGGTLSENVTSIGGSTANNISFQIRWNSQYSYNNGLVLPQKSILYTHAVISLHSYYYVNGTTINDAFNSFMSTLSNGGNFYNLSYTIASGNDLSFTNPISSQVSTIDSFFLPNADYNSIAILNSVDEAEAKLDQINGTIVGTRSAMNSGFSSVIALLSSIYNNVNELEGFTDALEEINNNIYKWERLQTLYNIQMMLALSDVNSDLNVNLIAGNNYNLQFDTYQENEDRIVSLYTVYVDNIDFNDYLDNDAISTGVPVIKQKFTSLWEELGLITVIPLYILALTLALTLIRHRPYGDN